MRNGAARIDTFLEMHPNSGADQFQTWQRSWWKGGSNDEDLVGEEACDSGPGSSEM